MQDTLLTACSLASLAPRSSWPTRTPVPRSATMAASLILISSGRSKTARWCHRLRELTRQARARRPPTAESAVLETRPRVRLRLARRLSYAVVPALWRRHIGLQSLQARRLRQLRLGNPDSDRSYHPGQLSGMNNGVVGAISGIVPLGAILYGLVRIARERGGRGIQAVLEVAREILSIGAWLTNIFSVAIIISAAVNTPASPSGTRQPES